jgi:hypothetical protein
MKQWKDFALQLLGELITPLSRDNANLAAVVKSD